MENKPTIKLTGRYPLKYRGTECRNCNHPLDMSDKYCPNCSQANSTKKLSLKDFFDEFFSTLISYDSKLLKTLSALLLRPGRITKDYIEGKRVSYTNPFRFLLSLSIIFFLMTNYSWNPSQLDRYGTNDAKDLFDNASVWNRDWGGNNEENEDVQKQLDSLQNMSGFKKAMQERKTKDSLILTDPKKHFSAIKEESTMASYQEKREFFNVMILKDSAYTFNDVKTKYDIPDTYMNSFAFNSAKGVIRAQRQPGSFLSAYISKLPFLIFFFLPVFALFIWVMYIRKKHSYTDHLIFSFHNQSLLFILLIISFLIDSLFNIYSAWFFLLIFLGYLYKSMRNFYGQGRFKTILKFMFLNTVFFTLALLSVVIFLTGSIFTY